MHMCVGVHTMSVEVKEQLAGIRSFLFPHGTEGWSSGCQAWRQVLLPTEPPRQPLAYSLNLLLGAEQLWNPQNHKRLFLVWRCCIETRTLQQLGCGAHTDSSVTASPGGGGPASSYHGHGEHISCLPKDRAITLHQKRTFVCFYDLSFWKVFMSRSYKTLVLWAE